MRRTLRSLMGALLLLGVAALSFTLRYILRVPQPLKSMLPGEARLYRWREGHIFYQVLGSSENPPLVVLHRPEIAASAYEMRSLLEGLAQRYSVFAVDLLGFGLSDHPDLGYTGEMYIEVCRDFLAQVVKRPATLLASGLSCNYSAAVADSAPELCERLIFLSPRSLFEQRSRPFARLAQIPGLSFALYAFLTTRPVLRLVMARQHGLKVEQITPSDMEHFFAAAHQLGAHRAALAYLAGQLNASALPQFERLRQPVLILWGVNALGNSQALARQHRMSTKTQMVLIRDAGLSVQEERPEQVVTSVLRWLDEEIPVAKGVRGREKGTGEGERVPSSVSQLGERGNVQVSSTSEVTAHIEVEVKEESNAPEQASLGEETKAWALETSELPEQSSSDQVNEVEVSKQHGQPEVEAGEEPQPRETEVRAENEQPEAEESEKSDLLEVEAYCVKCRHKRIMEQPQETVTKNGRRAMEGTCPVCGTRLFRFLASA